MCILKSQFVLNTYRGKSITQMKHYKTKACSTCSVFNQCTKNKEGRLIERSEHAPYIEQNRLNIAANTKTYKQRQAIVEHPYGIIKRQWGFYYIMTKRGIKRASADVGLMFTAFNLRRMMNIIDKKLFKKFLKELALFVLKIWMLLKEKSFDISPPKFSIANKTWYLKYS